VTLAIVLMMAIVIVMLLELSVFDIVNSLYTCSGVSFQSPLKLRKLVGHERELKSVLVRHIDFPFICKAERIRPIVKHEITVDPFLVDDSCVRCRPTIFFDDTSEQLCIYIFVLTGPGLDDLEWHGRALSLSVGLMNDELSFIIDASFFSLFLVRFSTLLHGNLAVNVYHHHPKTKQCC